MPFVNIRIVREVIADDREAKKSTMAERIVEAINDVTGIGKDDIWVVFDEVPARDWYVGATNVEKRSKAPRM